MVPPFTKTIPDLYVAAFLKTSGCIHEKTERRIERFKERCYFTFSSDRDIEPLITEYKSGKVLGLVPSDLFNALRELKAIIHDL